METIKAKKRSSNNNNCKDIFGGGVRFRPVVPVKPIKVENNNNNNGYASPSSMADRLSLITAGEKFLGLRDSDLVPEELERFHKQCTELSDSLVSASGRFRFRSLLAR